MDISKLRQPYKLQNFQLPWYCTSVDMFFLELLLDVDERSKKASEIGTRQIWQNSL